MKNVVVQTSKFGLVSGAVALLMALVGMIEAFSKRDIISGVISLGLTVLLLTFLFGAYFTLRRLPDLGIAIRLAMGALAGLMSSVVVMLVIVVNQAVDLRAMFVNVTPTLMQLLTFGQ